jgi:cyclase
VKIRIIPTILTDGLTVVKGENFVNWRTVGTAESVARVYGNRDVDELMFLDTKARKREERISLELIDRFAAVLNIPFSVGGGIDSVEYARQCLRRGAEKVVLGTSAIQNLSLVKEISKEFGTQAVVVAIDMASNFDGNALISSGTQDSGFSVKEAIQIVTESGSGEILLQSKVKDGTLQGYDLPSISKAAGVTDIPIIASGGCSSPENMYEAISAGAHALGVGALFQFTHHTPSSSREYLRGLGVPTRQA